MISGTRLLLCPSAPRLLSGGPPPPPRCLHGTTKGTNQPTIYPSHTTTSTTSTTHPPYVPTRGFSSLLFTACPRHHLLAHCPHSLCQSSCLPLRCYPLPQPLPVPPFAATRCQCLAAPPALFVPASPQPSRFTKTRCTPTDLLYCLCTSRAHVHPTPRTCASHPSYPAAGPACCAVPIALHGLNDVISTVYLSSFICDWTRLSPADLRS